MVAGAGAALPDRPGPGPGPGDDLHAGPNYIMDNYSEEILRNHNLDLQQHTMQCCPLPNILPECYVSIQ